MIFVLISQSIYEGYSIEKVFQEKNLKLKTKIKRIHVDLQDRDKEKEREREIDREREREREITKKCIIKCILTERIKYKKALLTDIQKV